MNTPQTGGPTPSGGTRLVENAAEAILAPAVAQSPDAPAVRDRAGIWTYAELDAASRAFEQQLRELGVKPGDRVLVRAGSVREFTAMLYGTWRLGAVLVPISFAMRSFHLRSVLADSEPALIVATAAERDGVEGLPWPAGTPVRILEELDFTAPPGELDAQAPAPEVPADRLALLIYTSGSTAAPKGVVCPHAPVVFAAARHRRTPRYRPDDVVLTAVPLSFDYGLYQILLSALAGAELLLADADGHARLLGFAREHGATVLPFVPSLARAAGAPGGTRSAADAAAPVHQHRRRAQLPAHRLPPGELPGRESGTDVRHHGVQAHHRAGPDEDLERPGSVGPALPGTEVLILDEDGRPLPAGDVGEIVVRGPHVMAGYWRAPELTAQRFRRTRTARALCTPATTAGSTPTDYLYFDGPPRRHVQAQAASA